jgi:hypothetical protein
MRMSIAYGCMYVCMYVLCSMYVCKYVRVVLGGVMVIVLVIRTEVRRFNPAEID